MSPGTVAVINPRTFGAVLKIEPLVVKATSRRPFLCVPIGADMGSRTVGVINPGTVGALLPVESLTV
jgi:hypothetical protein